MDCTCDKDDRRIVTRYRRHCSIHGGALDWQREACAKIADKKGAELGEPAIGAAIADAIRKAE
jgi:hypothetical protein